MSILKSHPKTVSVITAAGSKETRCYGMFTLKPLPGVVFCITKAVYHANLKKQNLPDHYTVTHYASGMSIGNSLTTKDPADHMGEALAKMGKVGFEKVATVIKAAAILNHDEEDWLL